jgi:hypothetical protein
MWNSQIDGTVFARITGASFAIKSPRDWTTVSTFGDDDTNGDQNLYVEDSTFIKVQQCPDADDNARFVWRYCSNDAVFGLTHGLTSPTGGRQFEYYNNTFSNTPDDDSSNIAGRYFWCRAGTGIFTDNLVNDAENPGLYGSPSQVAMGDLEELATGSHPIDRQCGSSWNGSDYYQEGVWLWNQTGDQAYDWGTVDAAWDFYVHEDRDIYINQAKPGYAKYTYPHPFRSVVEG